MKSGEEGPYKASNLVLRAAVMCIRPESLLNTTCGRDKISTASTKLVLPIKFKTKLLEERLSCICSPTGMSFFDPSNIICQPFNENSLATSEK